MTDTSASALTDVIHKILVVAAGIPDDAAKEVGHVGAVHRGQGVARRDCGGPVQARHTGLVFDAGVHLDGARHCIMIFIIVRLSLLVGRRCGVWSEADPWSTRWCTLFIHGANLPTT